MGLKRGRGKLITFEGAEGSGKSTQIKRAASYIRKGGYSVVLLREPGGTRISEGIRKILLNKKHREMSLKTELLLYLAARAQIVQEKILPALKAGKVVICDRYEDSTRAYQGYGRKLSLKTIEQVSKFVRGSLKPSLTFVLDVNVKKGLKRGGRRDRIEKESLLFHNRVRKGFLTLARKDRKRIVVLDSHQSVDHVTKEMQKGLNRAFRN